MKSKIITQVIPYVFDNYLIISLDREWMNVFKGIPTFMVTIDKDRRLSLITPPIPKTGQTNPKILEEVKV